MVGKSTHTANQQQQQVTRITAAAAAASAAAAAAELIHTSWDSLTFSQEEPA